MFFRCGDLIIRGRAQSERASVRRARLPLGPDLARRRHRGAHARMSASGFDVSEMRTGRKPGTQVFTVRNNTLGAPTLILQPSAAGDIQQEQP